MANGVDHDLHSADLHCLQRPVCPILRYSKFRTSRFDNLMTSGKCFVDPDQTSQEQSNGLYCLHRHLYI